MDLYATIKHNEKSFRLGYVLENPYKTVEDVVNVYGSIEAGLTRFNTLEDYHGSKGLARNEGYDSLEEAIETGAIKDTEKDVQTFLNSLDISVKHQLGGASRPSDKDKEKAQEKLDEWTDKIQAQMDALADMIGYEKPEKWTVVELSRLRCAGRAHKRAEARKDPGADFI